MQRPLGWRVRAQEYEVVLDSAAPFAGRFALRTRWLGTRPYIPDGRSFALLAAAIPADGVVGGRLRLSGYIRTQDVLLGSAHLWMSVNGASATHLASDTSRDAARGTTPWRRYTIEMPIDSAAASITFGVRLAGSGIAWFDSLALEIVGGPILVDVQGFSPAARPVQDLTRLLSDEELSVSDTALTPENADYAGWIKAHARPIRSLGSTDFSDLRFLAPLLAQKRIVQLGESSHGVSEYSLAKVRLIRYLHEELGFDVVAFESSLYECNRAQYNIASLTAERLMRSCIFGMWHVTEVLPLFEYLKATQATARPLFLAGVDQQPSAGMMLRNRPTFFRALVAVVDTSYASRVYVTDSTYIAQANTPQARTDAQRLTLFYDSLAVFLDVNASRIQPVFASDPKIVVLARQTARSIAADARRNAATTMVDKFEIRDAAMADNLEFLLTELYPGKKIIVWGHNEHVRYKERTRSQGETARKRARSMGTFVSERHRSALYTIGFFMYGGSPANNLRVTYPVMRPPSGSLESILRRAPWRYSFVDLSQANRESGNEWMWLPIAAMSSGTYFERLVPREEFDGLFFVETAHPPRYIYGRQAQ